MGEHHNGDDHIRMIIHEIHTRALQLVGRDHRINCWLSGTKIKNTQRWVYACRKAAEEAGYRWVATGRRCRDGARIVAFVNPAGGTIHLKLGMGKRTPIT